MASSSKAASGPRMTSTLSRSTSSCALVLAPAGLPPVSAETNSTLRPPIVKFLSLRNVSVPCSIWMPPWASGPVFTVSRPSLNGVACARGGRHRRRVARLDRREQRRRAARLAREVADHAHVLLPHRDLHGDVVAVVAILRHERAAQLEYPRGAGAGLDQVVDLARV